MANRDRSQGFAFVYVDLAKLLRERDTITDDAEGPVYGPEEKSIRFQRDTRQCRLASLAPGRNRRVQLIGLGAVVREHFVFTVGARLNTLFGLALVEIWIEGTSEYPGAFAAMRSAGVDAIVVIPTPEVDNDSARIAANADSTSLALSAGMPSRLATSAICPGGRLRSASGTGTECYCHSRGQRHVVSG